MVLQELGQIVKVIETRRIQFIGHIMRHNIFVSNIMERKINGKRGRGRPGDIILGNQVLRQ